MAEQQGLTPHDFKIFEAPFQSTEMGMKGKHQYIKRGAIMRRLRLVDPNYTMRNDTYVQVNGDVVTVWGELTIKGVTHHDSCSKNVECWRKELIDPNDPTKGQKYVRVDEYEYAREFANAVMKAQTGLLHRCAARFGLGVYLIEKTTPESLSSVLGNQQKPAPQSAGQPATTPPATSTPTQSSEPSPETPKHWATNGDGEKFKQRAKDLNLDWKGDIKANLESGKVLEKLSDTTLSFQAAYRRLDEIYSAKLADELEAKRQMQAKPDEIISVRGEELEVNDLVYGLGTRTPKRLIANLGDSPDGGSIYWAVWTNTDFTDTVIRGLFAKHLTFKVMRTGEPVDLPPAVMGQLEQLKHERQILQEGAEATT